MIIVDKRSCNRLYQWDVNQRLIIDGEPDGTLFDFVQRSVVLTLKPYSEDGHTYVNIPNSMLQINSEIVVYKYRKDGIEGHTEGKGSLFVFPREKPSDYIYTETEIYTIEEALQDAMKKAKESGDFRGEDGADGLTPYIGEDGNWWIGKENTGIRAEGKDGSDGADGVNGEDGKDGNGIKSVVLNSDYTLTLTFDDGESYTTPSIRGATGESGKDGVDGINGKDGHTPVKGEDYFTSEDKDEMVQMVIESLPNGDEVSY